ncbi:hypothetical protein FIBSPDRAFT_750856 [Athelia psychrophila]|uniref:Uncharacterized protein n=1 Tax=Athelia psychrophila TaxID=1759441 RepID=A0A166DRP3_9AGAM|nr:hypothetical protein FIBSPDRAFT_750856 [Fibularhizoctonia sp. CBS 109695]
MANSAGGDTASKLNARQINPWMLSTKWYLHVEGSDALALKAFVAPHREISNMVKSYFANATKLLGSTADLVLQKINSPDHIKDGITNVPFHKHEQPETLPIYCGVVTSLLNLLLEDREHYEKTLPEDTIIALNVFESALEGSMITTHDTSDELHKLLLQLWHREWATPSQESDIPDPTVRTLALRSLLADGSFKEPSAVAPDIAKFEHLMRLTSVREIHNLAALKYDGNQLKAANDVLPWLQEKLPTTFNSLRSLQHRATAIVYSTPSLPNAWWIDRENWTHLLYKGYPVKMDHISQVFDKLEQQSITHFEEKVLLKQKIRIDYDHIHDNLNKTDVGYSFLTEPENKKLFGNRDRLINAVLADPELKAKFFNSHADGSVTYNKNAWREWLHDYGVHSANMIMSCEMKAGAPSRLTELWNMCFGNTTMRTRNLLIQGLFTVINRKYTKTGNISGHDKLIPHALDALTGDMIIQDLAIARSFAELAVQICYPGDTALMDLYRYNLFVNNTKAFDTATVTEHMYRLTRNICSFQIGVRDWRQIHAAFARKLCGQAEHLLDVGDEDTAQVLQYGHGRSVHDNIYGTSGNVQGTSALPEDILPLFLEASTEWQITTLTVPGKPMSIYSHSAFIYLTTQVVCAFHIGKHKDNSLRLLFQQTRKRHLLLSQLVLRQLDQPYRLIPMISLPRLLLCSCLH